MSEVDAAVRSAARAVRALAGGHLTSGQLVDACLARIEAREATVQAWTHIDADGARAQAQDADARLSQGNSGKPLLGIPVGIKDIFDTADMPTENGTVLDAGRCPPRDSTVVARLREAGAIILGKTVTTEFAAYAPGKTRNPHDPEHTPGGSSSGSAAAVAAGMVPLAVGSQTNGSVIRPASFCGVVGFKPTHGLIPRTGALCQSRALDHVGVFANDTASIAMIAEALVGHDPQDPDTRPTSQPVIGDLMSQQPHPPPRLGLVLSPVWSEADDDLKSAFEDLEDRLGDMATRASLPPAFDDAVAVHRTVMETDMAASFEPYWMRGRDRMSAQILEIIERGRTVTAVAYMRARERQEDLREAVASIFGDFDALITPAATGAAPRGLETTGNPVFCTIWTLLGTPAVTLPLLGGAGGLPIGVQLVGPRGADARLLQTARWLVQRLEREDLA